MICEPLAIGRLWWVNNSTEAAKKNNLFVFKLPKVILIGCYSFSINNRCKTSKLNNEYMISHMAYGHQALPIP